MCFVNRTWLSSYISQELENRNLSTFMIRKTDKNNRGLSSNLKNTVSNQIQKVLSESKFI